MPAMFASAQVPRSITAQRTGAGAGIPLVAPTSSAERRARILAEAQGFAYLVSDTRTTGERDDVPAHLSDLVAATREEAPVPVAVGFGIGTPEQARAVADAGAQGVIIGSRLVRAASEAVEQGGDPAAAVGELVADFADALTR
jgi:tryptophan synthase alpha chain